MSREEQIDAALKIVRGAIDAPTFILPEANCRNLTRALAEIERVLTLECP